MSQWVVAHSSGWDELLLFGVPVLLALSAVRWAEKRAKARASSNPAQERGRSREVSVPEAESPD